MREDILTLLFHTMSLLINQVTTNLLSNTGIIDGAANPSSSSSLLARPAVSIFVG